MSDKQSSRPELYLDLLSENVIERNEAALLGVQKVCSKCGSGKIALSRPNALERMVISLLRRKPYRCLRCYNRFWVSAAVAPSHWPKVGLLAMLAIGLVIAAYFLLKQDQWTEQAPALATSSEPSAEKEPTANQEPSANKEPSADRKPSAEKEPSTTLATESSPVVDNPTDLSRVNDAVQVSLVTPANPTGQDNPLESARLQSQSNPTDSAEASKLEELMASRDNELLMLERKQVSDRLEQWRLAWQNGDAAAYLAYYSDTFKPGRDQSYDVWKAQRQERVTPDKDIQIGLSDVKISFDPDINISTVTFTQAYRSGDYADQSRKRLRLVRKYQEWQIVSEIQLP